TTASRSKTGTSPNLSSVAGLRHSSVAGIWWGSKGNRVLVSIERGGYHERWRWASLMHGGIRCAGLARGRRGPAGSCQHARALAGGKGGSRIAFQTILQRDQEGVRFARRHAVEIGLGERIFDGRAARRRARHRRRRRRGGVGHARRRAATEQRQLL